MNSTELKSTDQSLATIESYALCGRQELAGRCLEQLRLNFGGDDGVPLPAEMVAVEIEVGRGRECLAGHGDIGQPVVALVGEHVFESFEEIDRDHIRARRGDADETVVP